MKVLSVFMIYRICHLGCRMRQKRLLGPEHLAVLSAGPISHGSLQW